MPDEPAVLIAAISGRALAASARRGGYVPLVVDFFADQDTVALAPSHVRLCGGLARGIDAEEVMAALHGLAEKHRPRGVVCGAGFEDRPNLLARIAERWRLLGNDAHTVATLKDPLAFAALCRECALPHPEVSLSAPPDMNAWLRKRRGGAGGSHVGASAASHSAVGNFYFQRRVDGVPVSAMVLADGARPIVLGFSRQWSSPTPHQPFRYGGAVRPAELAPDVANALTECAERITSASGLVGLNSVDFLIDGKAFWLLEINPRPGATLDIFEPANGSLFALHVAACQGDLPSRAPIYAGAAASAIVYAEHDIASLPHLEWPEWTADRPHGGFAVKAGDPLCTVHAAASSAAQARRLVDERGQLVLAWTRARVA